MLHIEILEKWKSRNDYIAEQSIESFINNFAKYVPQVR